MPVGGRWAEAVRVRVETTNTTITMNEQQGHIFIELSGYPALGVLSGVKDEAS